MSRRPVHSVVRLGNGPGAAAMAQRRFRSDPGRWLPPSAIPITVGHRVRLSMATIAASLEVTAVVSMGLPLDPAPGLLVRSITWRAETVNDLFPVLRADLELHTTIEPMLRLVGSYTPPLSLLGALTDQVVVDTSPRKWSAGS